MFWNRNSLRNKLIIFLLSSIVIPISCSIVITHYYTKEKIRGNHIRENTNLLHQGSINMLNYLDRIDQTSLLVYNELSNAKSLYSLVQFGGINFLEQQEVHRSLQFMANTMREIEQIYLYMVKENLSFRFAYNNLRSASGRTYEQPPFVYNSAVQLEGTHPSHKYGIDKFNFHIEEDVISIHRNILRSPSTEVLGTISIDVNIKAIQQISEMLFIPSEEDFYIIDKDAHIIFSSTAEKIGTQTTSSWAHELLNTTEPSGNYEYHDEHFNGILMFERIENSFLNWTLVKRVPYEQLYKNARQLTLINSLVASMFLVIAVIAILYISFRFTSPIKKLLRYINKIETGRMDAELDINRTDEIGVLSKRFHQLMQRLDQLVMREYRLEIANKTNELKALQAQVNPHFMNNVLQSIGTLALQSNERKIYSLITSLGKMMRYQMNTNDTFVPLSYEIDYVKSYLALQSQRFEEKLQFYIDMDEQTRSIKVPKMILQPIVENYFKHGFKSRHNEGEIRIACHITSTNNLEIQVADNGTGIESSLLHTIQEQLNRAQRLTEGQGTMIGLMNVLARLRLYYSDTASITLASREPQGLLVTLSIPLNNGDDHL